jgi:hypothetical protein
VIKKFIFVFAILFISFNANAQCPGGTSSAVSCKTEASFDAYAQGWLGGSHSDKNFFSGSCQAGYKALCYTTDPDYNPCPEGEFATSNNTHTQSYTECTSDPDPTSCADAIQAAGGNGSFTQNPDGTTTCEVGTPGQCTVYTSGQACYVTPSGDPSGGNGGCQSGYLPGTVNGSSICVSAGGDGGAGPGPGAGDPDEWGSQAAGPSEDGTTTTIENGTNANGDSITTTTTTTTTSTPVTTTEPDLTAAPYTCQDGRAALDMASCDSQASCPSGYYIVYGTCVPLPNTTNTTTTTTSSTTTTTTNNTQGTSDTSTSTTSGSTTVAGGGGSSGGGTVTVELPGFDGPCDPSEANYLECIQGQTTLPEHTNNAGETVETATQGYFDRLTNAPIVQAFYNIVDVFPESGGSCPVIEIDLTNTILGTTVSTNVFCELAEILAPYLSALMLIVYAIAAFRIFASA